MATKPVIIPRDTPRWLVEHLRDTRRDVEQLSTGLASLTRNEAQDGSGSTIITSDTPVGAGNVTASDTVTSSQNIVAYAGADGLSIAELSGTQGEVLYHNGTAWVRLSPGTSGYFLKTLGAGANPAWAAESFAAIGGVQGDTLYHNGSGWTRLAPGTSGQFLKTLGAGNNPLWATDAFTAIGGVHGDILYHNGTTWVRLAAGNDGLTLSTQGAAANPRWTQTAGDSYFVDNVTDLVAAVNAGRGVITMAEQTYTLTDTLTITTGMVLRGSGDNTRIIYTADNHTDVIRIRAGSVTLENFEVSHSTGTGPDWGPTPGSGRGIVIDMEITGADNVGDIYLKNIRVLNTANWAIFDTGLVAYEDISYGDGVSSAGLFPNTVSHADAEMATRLSAEAAAKHPYPIWGHTAASAGAGFAVASDFSSGSKDITSNVANTFTNVRVGQYVYGTGIPHGSYVTVKTSQSAIKINNKTTGAGTAVSLTFKRATNCRLSVSLRCDTVTTAFIRSGGCLFHGSGGTAFRGQQFWTYSHSYGSYVSANQTDAVPMGQEHWYNHVSGIHESKSVYHGIGGSAGGPYKNIDATAISFDSCGDITYYSPYFENAGPNEDGIDWLHCYTLSCGKNTSTLLDAAVAGAFAPVSNGMRVSGKGLPAGTYVYNKISDDQLTLSAAATDSLTSDLRFSHDAFGYKEHWWFTGHNSADINFYEPSIYQSAYRKYVADNSGNSDEERFSGAGVPWIGTPPSGTAGLFYDGFPLRIFYSANDYDGVGKGAGCSFKLIGGRANVNRAHYSTAWGRTLPTGYPAVPHFYPCPENGEDAAAPWDKDDFVPGGDTTGAPAHPFIIENFQIWNWHAGAIREPTVWPGMGANNRACFSVRGPFSPLKLASFTDMYMNNGNDSSYFLSPRVGWSQDLKGGMLAYVGQGGSGNGADQREGFWGISARGQNWRQIPFMRIHPSIWVLGDTYAGDMWMQLSNAAGPAPDPYTSAVFKYYTDAAWVRCARVADASTSVAQNIVAFTGTDGVSMTTLTGTTGDILYHNGTSWVKRTAGSTDQFLAISAGAPAWRTLFDNANTWTKVQTFNEAADTVKLIVKGHSTQTSSLQEWKDSANNVVGYVDKDGNAVFDATVSGNVVSANAVVAGPNDLGVAGLIDNLYVKDSSSGFTATLSFIGVASGATFYSPTNSGTLATLDDNCRVAVNKNSGATVGTRRRINFIEGTNITLTVADDSIGEEVDVTIAASGQPSIQFKDEGTNKGTSGGVTSVNFTGAGVTATESAGALTVNIVGGAGEAFPVGSVFISVVSTNPATLLGYGTWSAIATGRMLVGLDSGDTDFDTVEETGGAKTHTLGTTNLPSHSHSITDPTHTHAATDTGHGHSLNDPGHNHTQNAHTHSQTSYGTSTGASTGWTVDTSMSGTTTTATQTTGSTTATNLTSTTSATVVDGAASITVDNASTGITTTNATGSGTAMNHMNPYFVVYMWKRTV